MYRFKKETILFVTSIFLLFPHIGHTQINIQDNLSVEQLIQQLGSDGVYIYNITYDCPYSGSSPSYGSFSDPTGTFGISKGITLTSGSARNTRGPNNSTGITQNNNSTTSDPDLQTLVDPGIKLYDACIIEFDVISHTDTLRFNYTFGSDEYPEYIASYHDAFGFFISGPGITGKKNIALVPGTNESVSVKNINHLKNTSYYINNDPAVNPSSILQYDGYTKLLQAKTKVEPCEIYHVKLAIADALDGMLDSGIFISNETLKGNHVKVRIDLDYPDLKTVTEGCNKGKLVFTRNFDLDKTYKAQYTIGGTATNGIDYQTIPTEVNFAIGQTTVSVDIIAADDNIAEGEETITISLANLCPNIPPLPAEVIKIRDIFDHTIAPISVCEGATIVLNPNSPSEYTFQWNANPALSCTNCASPTLQANESETFEATVTHTASGCKTTTRAQIIVSPKVELVFNYITDPNHTVESEFPDSNTIIEGCNQGKLIFTRAYGLSNPFTIKYKITGTATNAVDYQSIPTEVTFAAGQKTIALDIVGLEDNITEAEETIIITLDTLCADGPFPVETIYLRDVFESRIPSAAICKGNSVILNEQPSTNYTFQWRPDPALSCTNCTSPTVSTNESKDFEVLITRIASGCTTSKMINVTVLPIPNLSFTYTKDAKYPDGTIIFKLNDDTNINDVTWDFGDGNTSDEKNPTHSYYTENLSQEKLAFSVKVIGIDSRNNCINKDSTLIEITPFFIPNIITPNGDGINDLLIISGIEPGSWKLEIYNRFGQLVYFSDLYEMDWDGGNLSNGIYYYSLSNYYRDRTFKGWIQVLR